tara:strand:+ start:289 stop:495 length:207 start_codon:yes stop_codon:yes gene_type:complete
MEKPKIKSKKKYSSITTLTRKNKKNIKVTKTSKTELEIEKTSPSLFKKGIIIAITGEVRIETLKTAII